MSIDWSSSTEKLEVRKTSSICTWATCTRPMIFCTPTPLATPAHRVSTRRITLHRSAHPADMIVAWAPESTNALTGTPFTRQLMYLEANAIRDKCDGCERTRHIQHNDCAECLGIVFHGRFHIRLDILLTNLFGNQFLCFMIERIGHHHATTHLHFLLTRLDLLTQYRCKGFCILHNKIRYDYYYYTPKFQCHRSGTKRDNDMSDKPHAMHANTRR